MYTVLRRVPGTYALSKCKLLLYDGGDNDDDIVW